MSTQRIPAGEQRRILWTLGTSMPSPVRFRAETENGTAPTGKVVVSRRTIFTRRSETAALEAENQVIRGFWDSDFRITVTPEQTCTITFQTRHLRAQHLLWMVIAIVAVAVGTVFLTVPPPA